MKSELESIQWPGWETIGLIGRGSFGGVYEIQREVRGRTEHAALKVITIPSNKEEIPKLRADGYDDNSITKYFADSLERIEDEYAMMADMKGHANIVYCDDIRTIQHDDGFGWDIYIKMELLTPMKTALGSSLSDEQVIKFGMDMCNALILCKQLNIVHRDIKPENIFMSRDGGFKLGDFGIAKTMEETTGGTITGTYDYMAPEVYNNRPYHQSADMYSLGLVMYWMLNNRRLPFIEASTPTSREKAQARERRFAGENIPAPQNGSDALKRIVLKACAHDPKNRFATAAEMYRELESCLNDGGTVRGTVCGVKACTGSASKAFGKKVYGWIAGVAAVVLVAALSATAFKTAAPNLADRQQTETAVVNAVNVSVETPEPTPMPTPTPLVLPEIQVGDYVTFGKYEQNGNSDSKENIEWIVLDKDGDGILLISRYCLDAQPYEADGGSVTWEDSSLRSWLNGTFLDNAFSSSEKDMIISTTLTNGNNPVHGTEGGDNTEDYAFVLSISEAEFYCRNVSTQAASTQYAINRGVFSRDTSGYSWLWLRSPGKSGSKAAYIRSDGEYAYDGESVSNSEGGVRPCVWVDTSEYKNGSTTLKKLDVVELNEARIGDRVYFGAYEQDDDSGNDKEPIEWTVLEKEGNRILVISSYCLDALPYEKSGSSVTWADSTIRDWLNSSFMETAFDTEEQEMILYTKCYNDDNPVHYTNGGVDTEDQVFLLSIDEVQKYMTSTHAMPTEYALEQGVLLNDYSRNSWWWLRTPGENSYTACCISSGAFYMYEGAGVGRSDGGVRPAMWISVM